jgi:hypothetical protein
MVLSLLNSSLHRIYFYSCADLKLVSEKTGKKVVKLLGVTVSGAFNR